MSKSPLVDPFESRSTFETGDGEASYFRLSRLDDLGLCASEKLPFSIRVLLESVLRNCDGFAVTEDDEVILTFFLRTFI